MNDGPATTASRITGLTQSDVAKDNASLYTSKWLRAVAGGADRG